MSSIPVEKADPAWLEDPLPPEQPTEEQLKNGATNSAALEVITRNNSKLWQQDRDIRREWSQYYKRLVASGVIK